LLLWDLEEMLARLSDSVFDVEGWLDGGAALPPVVPFRFFALRTPTHGTVTPAWSAIA
jgi:hypothetical protein